MTKDIICNMDYIAKVKFVFEGTVSITNMNSKEEAKQEIQNNIGLVLGGNIHTSSSDIYNWDFDTHPEKIIVNCKKNG